MSPVVAEIRANWTRMLLESYERTLDPDLFRRAMDRVDPALLRLLDESGPLDWLDARVHLAVAEAPFGLIPRDEFRQIWRRHILDSFEKPIFHALIQGALRLFHRSPLSLARVVPNGWALVSRHCGRFVVTDERGDESGTVMIVDLPPHYRESEAWAIAWAAALEAFIVLAGTSGTVSIDLSRRAEGRFEYAVRWSRAAAIA